MPLQLSLTKSNAFMQSKVKVLERDKGFNPYSYPNGYIWLGQT